MMPMAKPRIVSDELSTSYDSQHLLNFFMSSSQLCRTLLLKRDLGRLWTLLW
jgi:hypothetical protein